MDGVRVKRVTFKRSGKMGFPVQLPHVWVRDVGLVTGGTVDIFRTADDRLYIEMVPDAGQPRVAAKGNAEGELTEASR